MLMRLFFFAPPGATLLITPRHAGITPRLFRR